MSQKFQLSEIGKIEGQPIDGSVIELDADKKYVIVVKTEGRAQAFQQALMEQAMEAFVRMEMPHRVLLIGDDVLAGIYELKPVESDADRTE